MIGDLDVRIGYGAGTGVKTVEAVRSEAKWAASAGFDSFWLSQVFGVDPIVALAAVGDAAPELAELGTSVVPMVGRHPLALAAQSLTAQSALGGRFTLGIGTSHRVVVEGFFGERYGGARSRTAEYLAALVPLLNGHASDVQGEHVYAKGWLTVDAAPVPVLLAALGPRMLELAGQLTAGTTVGSCGPRTIATHVAPLLNEAAARAGRSAPRIVALVGVCVTDDPDRLRAALRADNVMYDAFPSYRAALDLEGVASGADLAVLGSIDQIVDGLGAYVAAGVTDLRIAIAASTDDERAATRAGLELALHS